MSKKPLKQSTTRTIIDVEQGSPGWFQAKLGIPSASEFHKIITTDGKRSKQRDKYLYKLAGEAVCGVPEDTYQSDAMLRGKEMESEARSLYEFKNEVEVNQVGFCRFGDVGCSPDGLIGDDGGLEIKCPNIATHVWYMHNGKLPIEYFSQVQGSLYVTGREWWDFMSYFPRLRPFIIRVEPDNGFFASLEKELKEFCTDLGFIKKEIT